MTLDLSARAARPGREARQFTVRDVELRSAPDGSGGSKLHLRGYASVTESPYMITDWLGDYSETVKRGAFKRSLKNKDDVRLLLNHDGMPLARTKSGTLTLDEDERGLAVDADLDVRSGLVNDVGVAMERGDLDEMSFGFQVTDQEWSEDFTERSIREVKLFDVSVVTYPANPATSVALRGVEAVDILGDDDARAVLARLQTRFAATETGGVVLPLYVAQAEALRLRRPA
jgi:HK97 family phage prohead protease